MVETPSKTRYVARPSVRARSKRVRYQALRHVRSRPQLWGTVTVVQPPSSYSTASAPVRSSLPWNRHGAESAVRARSTEGDGAGTGASRAPPHAASQAARNAAAIAPPLGVSAST